VSCSLVISSVASYESAFRIYGNNVHVIFYMAGITNAFENVAALNKLLFLHISIY
jgi:hypothetical protein